MRSCTEASKLGHRKIIEKLCHGLEYLALDCSAYVELLNIKFHEFSSFLVLVVSVTKLYSISCSSIV